MRLQRMKERAVDGWGGQGMAQDVRGRCYSILPVLTLDGLIAWDIIEGSVTSERFVQFL